MSAAVLLLILPASAAVTGGALRVLGVPPRRALVAGAGAAVVTFVAVAALFLTAFGECIGDGPDPETEASWPWSPRREFCADDDSPAALGALALLLLPTPLVILGAWLRSRGRAALGSAVLALLLATPAAPSLYVEALPVYRLDSYPILHQPLLRTASGSRPARVCYVFGIAFGPRKVTVEPDTRRECVDFAPTREASTLTPAYDEGRTLYDLEWVGKNLTQKGLPIEPGPTGIDGLVVDRAYRLTDREARAGATLVE